jgi:hypothetical protein
LVHNSEADWTHNRLVHNLAAAHSELIMRWWQQHWQQRRGWRSLRDCGHDDVGDQGHEDVGADCVHGEWMILGWSDFDLFLEDGEY